MVHERLSFVWFCAAGAVVTGDVKRRVSSLSVTEPPRGICQVYPGFGLSRYIPGSRLVLPVLRRNIPCPGYIPGCFPGIRDSYPGISGALLSQ